MKPKKLLVFSLLLAFIITATGCLGQKTTTTSSRKIELTYYKLFDDQDLIQPIITEFQSKYKNVRIKYKKFTDVAEYENLIINELAEGEGPDIFEIHNSWLTKHKKKLTPMPDAAIFPAPQLFRETFADIASEDLIRLDENNKERIYGIPLNLDNLAIYYNKSHFEAKIPSEGRPSKTWEGIKEDVYKLTKQNNSDERFETAGIAMGRADNISRATDILYLLMLQYGTQFYDDDFKQAGFAKSQGIDSLGKPYYPGIEALDFYTSFTMPINKHYSWNKYMANAENKEKEISAFVTGKVSMIIGYSYLYQDIIDLINTYDKRGLEHINKKDVHVAPIPQVSAEEKDCITYGNYFAETVSRTSKNPDAAWKFILFLAQKQNQQEYFFDKAHKITSRRDLIKEQGSDPIYGVFAKQIGCAKSIIMMDDNKYKKIFDKAINDVLQMQKPATALKTAESAVNSLIPSEGIFPSLPWKTTVKPKSKTS